MADGKPKGSDQPRLSAFDPPQKPKRNKYALACSILASMTSILLGYDIGVMSGAIIYIQKDLGLTDVQKEIIMGIINVYSLFGSAAAGRTSDWIGRRYTIVLAGAIFFCGALLMGFATSYAFLMVARFVAGIGVGYALMIAPVYAAEVAPASSRGFLTSFPEVFINFGVLLGYVSNFCFSKLPTHLGWRIMLGLGAVPSVFLAFGVLAMPESPRWLIMRGRLVDAKKVLDRTSDSPEESELRLSEIKDSAAVTTGGHTGVWRSLVFRPTRPVRHILMCAVGIHFFQQASGIDSVVLYSPEIFERAGIKNDTDKLLATMGVGFSKTAFVLVATFRIGRRFLLLTSVAGMVVSSAGLGIGLTVIEQHSDRKLGWAVVLCIVAVLSFVAFFSIGMGPITWVYSSEIFPLRLRAQGCGIAVATNRLTSGVVSMTFISLYEGISIGGSFLLFSGIGVVAWVFFYTLFPETEGKTLEEMEGLFGTFFGWRATLRELKENKSHDDDDQVQLTSS